MATLINSVTNFADQLISVALPDATRVDLELIYQGTTERWIMNVAYGAFTANGVGVCCFPNVLRQWRNVIPFGIACVTPNLTDPVNINDFSNGIASLYLLSSDDVEAVETSVFGALPA